MNWKTGSAFFTFAVLAASCAFTAIVGSHDLLAGIRLVVFFLPWIGCVLYYIQVPGPKSTALFSIGAIALCHVGLLPTIQRARETGYRYPYESIYEVFGLIAWVCLFAFWLVFALSSGASSIRPNRILGRLSLLCVFSPFVLFFLDGLQGHLTTLSLIDPNAPQIFELAFKVIWGI